MSSAPHDITVPGAPHVQEVSEDIYAYIQPDGTWWINNTGFLVGKRGVVSIDACSTERRTRAYLDTIRGITPRPVRTLVNTHHHGDHTFGNYLFEGATIVGHEAVRAGMRNWGLPRSAPYWTETEWGDIQLEPPFLTYTDAVTLWVDELRCEVRHVGTAAHTTCDSIVWVPERRVLFAGDLLFNGGTPFLLQGSVAGAIQVLTELVAPLGAETIVAGHGPVSGPGLIEEVLGYCTFVQSTARTAFDAGLSPLQAARDLDLGSYAELADSERIVGNLHRAYAEIAGAAPGDPINTAAALEDMVTYNNGRPLTCRA
ncbi:MULTISPECIES: MBL fold metallo-hydrolase [unclassified Streptomyces]|uniref:MBL fold metallo-hydrolase n=1 Tax=unclassified Streptomyces TaxID=2593676 RepID=UPI002DD7D6A4|nr:MULTISPECIES: MBL fold metallo-hydrolase [unclassified Streptomyces]WSB80982.1 MBL fold metallo-hydrolase [Streptomyces sp. NBC_01775]WSS10807.1 MBL fold metallo-hydrolase [Streptomyces sp. NBC_01186]WSS39506.1 MBL fold metallo-hydrolase [Streptomyces sp. NBC_01187]